MKRKLAAIAKSLSEEEIHELFRLKRTGDKKVIALTRKRDKIAENLAKVEAFKAATDAAFNPAPELPAPPDTAAYPADDPDDPRFFDEISGFVGIIMGRRLPTVGAKGSFPGMALDYAKIAYDNRESERAGDFLLNPMLRHMSGEEQIAKAHVLTPKDIYTELKGDLSWENRFPLRTH